LEDLATRIIVRDEGPLEAVAPRAFLAATGPAWRKRAADGRTTHVWAIADGSAPTSPDAGAKDLPSPRVGELFGSLVVLLASDTNALAAGILPGEVRGWWAQDKFSIGIVRGAIVTVRSD
jgi:hypothetical protein